MGWWIIVTTGAIADELPEDATLAPGKSVLVVCVGLMTRWSQAGLRSCAAIVCRPATRPASLLC